MSSVNLLEVPSLIVLLADVRDTEGVACGDGRVAKTNRAGGDRPDVGDDGSIEWAWAWAWAWA